MQPAPHAPRLIPPFAAQGERLTVEGLHARAPGLETRKVVTPISALTALQQLKSPRKLGVMFITLGVAAVMMVEVARPTIRQTSRWSDRQHFTSVGVVWASVLSRRWCLHWGSSYCGEDRRSLLGPNRASKLP